MSPCTGGTAGRIYSPAGSSCMRGMRTMEGRALDGDCDGGQKVSASGK